MPAKETFATREQLFNDVSPTMKSIGDAGLALDSEKANAACCEVGHAVTLLIGGDGVNATRALNNTAGKLDCPIVGAVPSQECGKHFTELVPLFDAVTRMGKILGKNSYMFALTTVGASSIALAHGQRDSVLDMMKLALAQLNAQSIVRHWTGGEHQEFLIYSNQASEELRKHVGEVTIEEILSKNTGDNAGD